MADATPRMYGELADWFHLLTAPDEYAAEAAQVPTCSASSPGRRG